MNSVEAHVERVQTSLMSRLTLRPLKIPADMAAVCHWVTRPYAHYWGMQGFNEAQVTSAYREILAPEDVDAFMGEHSGAPAF
ncbi:MAG: GNAT family N-acetyltransferase, partial [Myxococcota bacterium]